MVTQEITLKNEEGLHARPATEIAKNASKYTCSINLEIQGNLYNAKSVGPSFSSPQYSST